MKLSLADALMALEEGNDNHWTADGLPRIDTINALTGETHDRKGVTTFAPAFTRSNRVLDVPEDPPAPPETLEGVTTVTDSPVAVVTEEPMTDEQELHLLEQEIHELTILRDAHNHAIQSLEARRDVVVMRMDAKVRESGSTTIQGYLASQRRALEARGNVRAKVVESGVDLKALSEVMSPAPIDAARRRR